MQHSSMAHRAMIEASREENRALIAEMHAAREDERQANETICSLFREALDTILEMSRTIMMSKTGATHQGMQRPVEEHHFEPLPSTSEVDVFTFGGTQEESAQVVPPAPESLTPITETPDVKPVVKAQRPTLAGFRSRRTVKARKPYSPSK